MEISSKACEIMMSKYMVKNVLDKKCFSKSQIMTYRSKEKTSSPNLAGNHFNLETETETSFHRTLQNSP